VADLLNFARQQEVLAQECNIHDLIEQVIEGISRKASFQKVTVVRQFSPQLPAIEADQAQLMQVFVNLLDNAADAMPAGGTITIRTSLIDNQRLEVRISDTGGGISEENLGKLFTPFFTTKPVGKGTGLGLSIVYGIIKMHRGQITVNSQAGQGATFIIILPVLLSQQHLPPAANPSELTV
jgi:two-component system NtrC family sensor kinase